ncbi:Uncharacterized protein dnm_002530 [Desulfonema magnum]|uniref:Uncharacterized protein n=1 Tax=Desulfonema magnum TaxID=45655 RepID=A0A975BEJ2_9BACT|nr:Uncharacterized protein dnm_002530 [Desulfonema magnum]
MGHTLFCHSCFCGLRRERSTEFTPKYQSNGMTGFLSESMFEK